MIQRTKICLQLLLPLLVASPPSHASDAGIQTHPHHHSTEHIAPSQRNAQHPKKPPPKILPVLLFIALATSVVFFGSQIFTQQQNDDPDLDIPPQNNSTTSPNTTTTAGQGTQGKDDNTQNLDIPPQNNSTASANATTTTAGQGTQGKDDNTQNLNIPPQNNSTTSPNTTTTTAGQGTQGKDDNTQNLDISLPNNSTTSPNATTTPADQGKQIVPYTKDDNKNGPFSDSTSQDPPLRGVTIDINNINNEHQLQAFKNLIATQAELIKEKNQKWLDKATASYNPPKIVEVAKTKTAIIQRNLLNVELNATFILQSSGESKVILHLKDGNTFRTTNRLTIGIKDSSGKDLRRIDRVASVSRFGKEYHATVSFHSMCFENFMKAKKAYINHTCTYKALFAENTQTRTYEEDIK